jgi:peptidoglycan/LPS O-acetylase OafA/YrhL
MKTQIDALTSTRAFAAIMVFIFHFGALVTPFKDYQRLFHNGNIAVSYFFVLSGFVLYISYVEAKAGYWQYLKKRVARIAPVYLLALGLFLCVYFFVYKIGYSTEVGKEILYSALFIHAYLPEYALKLNVAAWSISVEMLFYLTFPLLLLLLKKRVWLFVALTVLLFTVTQVFFYKYFQGQYQLTTNFNFFLFNPVMHMNQFLVGMLGGLLFKKLATSGRKFPLVPTVLLALIVTLVILKPDTLYFDVGLLAPLFMLFIISVAINDNKLLKFKPFVFLGEISYGMYILQFPVREWLFALNNEHKLLSPNMFFYFSFGALVLAATLTYYFFERPLRNMINSIGAKRRAAKTGL